MDSRYDHHQHEDRIYELWEAAEAFNPDKVATLQAQQWPKSSLKKTTGAAKDKVDKPAPTSPFSIMMPPPNANDPLHIGHAMGISVQDVLIRFHRMLGDDTLWLPGTDHAGIETQFVFEKKLKKEDKSRFQFDRQTLYQMIWDYVQENSSIAVNQTKKLGASADWSRFTFMLDPQLVKVTLNTFQSLYEKGLIYRDLKLVNFCVKCGTSFSELEVLHKEQLDPLYYIKYGPFTIATVRPETKFRDTALAVHPSDPRYQKYIGQTLSIPGLLGPISMKIIADEGVDPEFGTGIMKVTPAHDFHDFELGQKYQLPVTPIIDFTGRMDFSWYLDDPSQHHPDPTLRAKYLERAQRYHGLKIPAMRTEMVKDFDQDGLLLKTDTAYNHTIGTCYRCGSVIEPLPLPQFFIKVAPLVKPALAALKQKQTTVLGAGHDKILQHWLTNLKDWNISRQIVWGIRIPVWYSISQNPRLQVTFLDKNGQKQSGLIGDLVNTTSVGGSRLAGGPHSFTLAEIKAGLQELRAPVGAEFTLSPTPPGDDYLQETDTFDTWFSSGQWPFATLQALDSKNSLPLAVTTAASGATTTTTISTASTSTATPAATNLSRFYPNAVMETAYDILPFWVMRMMLLGLFTTGEVPFRQVYLHGLIRDAKGQKMSKSKGNVINFLTIIDTYGADALRLALVVRSSPGLDKSVSDQDFKAMRNFTNKLWNAARYVTTLGEKPTDQSDSTLPTEAVDKLHPPTSLSQDQAFLQHLQELSATVTQQLQDLRVGFAGETLYNEFWHWYCDQAIEAHKQGLLSTAALTTGLTTFLKLLHPFAPFITEAIWQEQHSSSAAKSLLIVATWPSLATNEVL